MSDITTRLVPAHAALVDRRVIPAEEMQAYFDRVYAEAGQVLKNAGIRRLGPARCYYFSPVGETVDIASGFPVRMDTVNKLNEQLGESSTFKVVRHGDLRAKTLRYQGDGSKLNNSWEKLHKHVEESDKDFGDVAWEDFITVSADSDQMTVDLFWSVK